MADNMALLRRMMRTQTTDVVHTSAHAAAQNNGGFGAASTQSFAARRSIEEQRKLVRGYHNSKIMGGAMTSGPRAKTYTPPPPKAPMVKPGARPVK